MHCNFRKARLIKRISEEKDEIKEIVKPSVNSLFATVNLTTGLGNSSTEDVHGTTSITKHFTRHNHLTRLGRLAFRRMGRNHQ